MKNFLIILMFGLFACVTANARDVGTQLQADVGTTVLQMQQPIFTAELSMVTVELAPAVQYNFISPAENKISAPTRIQTPILWIDPGSCQQVSISNSTTYKGYSNNKTCNPTARHVSFFLP